MNFEVINDIHIVERSLICVETVKKLFFTYSQWEREKEIGTYSSFSLCTFTFVK
jgi:hypothetical protein